MKHRGTLTVFADPEAVALAAATLFAEEAALRVGADGVFSVVLAGGSTPGRTYELLSQPSFRDRIPWGGVHVFWGDERCVRSDDPRSNERMARETLLDAVPIPESQIHPLRCASHPREAAARYESLLRDFFVTRGAGPDLVLLGLGDNGHTASLFPYAPVLSERDRWVAEVFVDAAAGAGTTAAGEDLWRVTLTAPFINTAANVLFLATGPAKAGVVKEVVEGAYDPDRLPAQLIRPVPSALRWYLDSEAATHVARRGT
ncbi:MAG: 6-phosphogluconolactonase [Thermoleophilia bacterium]